MSEHTISWCQKCGGITVTPSYPASLTAQPYPKQGMCRCPEDTKLQNELIALRSQVAELQHRNNTQLETLIQVTGKLQAAEKKLDETARQEPIIYLRMYNGKPDWAEDCIGDQCCVIDGYDEDSFTAEPLYRLPPNIAALIEQAKAEKENRIIESLIEFSYEFYAESAEREVLQRAATRIKKS